MTDDRKSAFGLIAGSLGGLLTMAIHPVAPAHLVAAQIEQLALVSAIAHSIAMLSIVTLVLGACGLTRRLAAPDRLAFSGLVFYVFGVVAILIAASVGGFIVPNIMRHMFRDTPAAAPQWHIAIDAVFQFNQAFANIFTAATSIAMALWSASALRHGGLARGMALYGCLAALLMIMAIGSGHLRMNVHGMALVAVAQGIWFIGAAVDLLKKDSAQSRVLG